MTSPLARPHAPSSGDGRPSAAVAPEIRPAGFAAHRTVTVGVAGGLDAVLRVAMMLRGRRYRVRDLAVHVREGVVVSEIRVVVVLTADETDLLLERLRRLPEVLGADRS